MKVKDLIEHLSKLDPELPVIAAKDDEGNGYHHCNYAPSPAYCPELEEYLIEEVHYEDNFEEYKEDGGEPIINCVVI